LASQFLATIVDLSGKQFVDAFSGERIDGARTVIALVFARSGQLTARVISTTLRQKVTCSISAFQAFQREALIVQISPRSRRQRPVLPAIGKHIGENEVEVRAQQ
jgi:hypothetical protein